jgi:uncharacterized membrane protein
MAGDTSSPGKGPTRWLRALLIVSLALNLLVAGVVAGALLGREGRDGAERGVRQIGLGPFEHALTRTDRRAIRGDLRERGGVLRAGGRDLRASFEDAIALLRSEPFDAAGFSEALMRNRAAIALLQAQGHALFAEYVSDMDAEQRKALADRVEAALPRRRVSPRD